MGSYVNGTLIKGEQVVHEGRISIWSLLPLIILGLITIFAYGIGLIFWGIAVIRYLTTELAVTNKRVIAKFGLIGRNTIEMNLAKVESIQVKQSILGRIFNYGSLVISGAGNPQTPVPGIASPMDFRRMAMEAQDQSMTV